jgi:hypothetical protein
MAVLPPFILLKKYFINFFIFCHKLQGILQEKQEEKVLKNSFKKITFIQLPFLDRCFLRWQTIYTKF